MNKATLYKTLLLFAGILFAAGCQNGGEKLASTPTLTHQANPVVQAKVAQPSEPAPSSPAPRLPAPTETSAVTAVTLAAARTETVHRGPALITLAAGEDIQHYLDGAHRRVILDFYADWCGPCRQQGRVLHEIESEASRADALIVKINIDQHERLARALSIESLPTLMVWGEGRIMERRSGLANAAQIRSWIEAR